MNDTVTIRYDLSPAMTEGIIRDKLIELGWTPPTPKPEIPEGFTAWHGGECLVPSGVVVEYYNIIDNKLYGPYETKEIEKSLLHNAFGAKFYAYRIIKPTTFTLNGEVLPRADYVGKRQSLTDTCVHFGHTNMWYKSREDADKVRAAFAKLGEGL